MAGDQKAKKNLSPVDEKKLKDKATELFAKGKYKKVLPMYIELSQAHPKDLRLKTKVGDILRKLSRYPDAAAVYQSVAAQYACDGMLIQAIAVNKMILEMFPEEKGIQKELAQLYSQRKEAMGTSPLGRISTVVRPIKIQEISLPEPAESLADSQESTAYVHAGSSSPESSPLVISIPVASPRLDLASKVPAPDIVEIPGRILDFSEAIDLGNISEISLPPTPLFSDLEANSLEKVLNYLVRREFQAEDLICREGEAGDSIFIVSEGSLKVSTQDSGGTSLHLATLTEGDFFGEFGYFSDHKRHASVSALNAVVLLELKREDMDAVIREFPQAGEVLQAFYQKRLLDTLLAKSRIFQRLDASQRKSLATCFTLEQHAPGELLMREGEIGNSMVLIQQGQLKVETEQGGQRVSLATLREGDFCGEFSVLTHAKRTADVTCLTATKLLRLSKDAARDFFQKHPEVKKTLQAIAQERVQGTIRALAPVSTTDQERNESRRGLI